MFTLSCAGSWLPGDFCSRFYEAAKHGFQAVEMLEWTGVDLNAARAASDESGVILSAILTQSKDSKIQAGLQNTHGIVHEDMLDGFVQAVRETVDAAVRLNCPNIIAVTGNERKDISREQQRANVVKALQAAAPIAQQAGIQIVLEPLNILVDHKGYFLVTSDEGFSIVQEVDSPNVSLLYDVYHQQISEGNLINTISRNHNRIGHIHIADVPGRLEPGTGEINCGNVLKAIKAAGYHRYVALECGLSTDLDTACNRMHSLMDQLQ